jgi:inhibitor of cysteine peptidase
MQRLLLPLAALSLLTLAACQPSVTPPQTGSGAALTSAAAVSSTAAGSSANAADEDVTETTDAPRGITVGQTFRIVLRSNPTTGYSWMADFDQTVLEKVTDTFVAPRPVRDIVGASGHQVFTFRAKTTGTTTLTLTYARPWESVQPIETKTYEITVK